MEPVNTLNSPESQAFAADEGANKVFNAAQNGTMSLSQQAAAVHAEVGELWLSEKKEDIARIAYIRNTFKAPYINAYLGQGRLKNPVNGKFDILDPAFTNAQRYTMALAVLETEAKKRSPEEKGACDTAKTSWGTVSKWAGKPPSNQGGRPTGQGAGESTKGDATAAPIAKVAANKKVENLAQAYLFTSQSVDVVLTFLDANKAVELGPIGSCLRGFVDAFKTIESPEQEAARKESEARTLEKKRTEEATAAAMAAREAAAKAEQETKATARPRKSRGK